MPNNRMRALKLAAAMCLSASLFCVAASCAKAQEAQPTSSASATFSAASVSLPEMPDRSFDVKTYGAVGDANTDDTAAIQAAIDAAGTAGGGKVVIPAGTFLSGPISLTNSLNLHLSEGSVLLMLPFERYPDPSQGEYRPLIRGYKLHDVELSGSGTIQGQGQAWWAKYQEGALKAQRPEMANFWRITRLAIRGVHMENAPMAHVDIGKSSDITIDGITISSPDNSPNTDGIDVWGTNIAIKNCKISSGDDHIAVSGYTSNVSITNCKMGVGHGISIGSSTEGGVSNMAVDNCQFEGSINGLRGKSNRTKGGVVENLTYSNITMNNVNYPIRFESTYDMKLKQPEQTDTQPVAGTTPVWKNITFTNITATAADKYGAGIIWGLPEAPIENFTFKNVNIMAYKGFKVYFAKNIVFADDSHVVVPDGKAAFFTYQTTLEAQGTKESMEKAGQ